MSPAWPSSSSLRNISTPVTDRLARVAEADDLDLFADLDDAALDATRRHRAAALDREHVLDRHQERLVDVAHRLRDLACRAPSSSSPIDSSHFASPLSAGSAATADDRRVVAVELVLVEELADFHLDEVEHLRVVHRVALVQEHDDVVQTDLAREEHVLARLRHHQSSALTTRIAPSICAAPVIMFLM